MAISGGLFTGFITSRQWFLPPKANELFDDRFQWYDCEIEHEKLHELEELHRQSSMSNSKLQNQGHKSPGDELEDEDQRLADGNQVEDN
jgi:hypothetical protein